jgi:hypothetical protein
MSKFVKKIIRFGGLILRYITRILFAPNHFNVPFFTRLKYNIRGGYMADQIMLYDFKHNDPNEYLSEFDWYKSRYINEPFSFILNNKVVCADLLKQYIHVPRTYVMKINGRLSSYSEKEIVYENIIQLLRYETVLFLKPINAGKGKGVYMLSYKNRALYVDDDEVSEEKLISFLKKQDDWFISEYVRQSDYLNRLYDKTTNTIRLITMKDPKTEKFKVFFAVQRIGTSKTIPVDNGSKGGLVAKIDLETGELSEARSIQSLEVHENHPDTGTPIKGVKIPNWTGIKEQMLGVANKFPYLNFIAWDVLLTEHGVTIIEANTSSGVNIIQIWGGQKQGELGDFYRHYNVIK